MVFLTLVSFSSFPQEDFLLEGEGILSLEDISKQLGTPIAVISWRTQTGVLRIKRAVKGGNYERRYIEKDGTVIFEDRAEMEGYWQQWYQTGANELPDNETLESILEQIWENWEYGITSYHENIDKTMLIKFYKSDDNGFVYNDDGYLYIYGYWYFIDGKL
jgi:acyl-coenzyme A synthetase/AMP-(fatty) acid ligase